MQIINTNRSEYTYNNQKIHEYVYTYIYIYIYTYIHVSHLWISPGLLQQKALVKFIRAPKLPPPPSNCQGRRHLDVKIAYKINGGSQHSQYGCPVCFRLFGAYALNPKTHVNPT